MRSSEELGLNTDLVLLANLAVFSGFELEPHQSWHVSVAISSDTAGKLSEAISRPGGATDISRRRSPSVGAGTDKKGFFASRQGRRTRILDSNNLGPAPFQGAWRCCDVSGG
jgi:hypothetical protein